MCDAVDQNLEQEKCKKLGGVDMVPIFYGFLF